MTKWGDRPHWQYDASSSGRTSTATGSDVRPAPSTRRPGMAIRRDVRGRGARPCRRRGPPGGVQRPPRAGGDLRRHDHSTGLGRRGAARRRPRPRRREAAGRHRLPRRRGRVRRAPGVLRLSPGRGRHGRADGRRGAGRRPRKALRRTTAPPTPGWLRSHRWSSSRRRWSSSRGLSGSAGRGRRRWSSSRGGARGTSAPPRRIETPRADHRGDSRSPASRYALAPGRSALLECDRSEPRRSSYSAIDESLSSEFGWNVGRRVGVLAARTDELEARGRRPPARPGRRRGRGAGSSAQALCSGGAWKALRPISSGVPTKTTGRPSDSAQTPQIRLSAHCVTRRPTSSPSPPSATAPRRTVRPSRAGLITVARLRRRAGPPTELGPARRAARRRCGACGRAAGSAARAGRCLVQRVRQRQLHDGAQRLAVLPVERTGRVGDVVLGGQCPHLLRDLGIPVARQVREEVVLDLEAEAAGEDVQQPAALEVRRAEDLPEVPLRPGLVLDLLLGEVHRAVGEVAAEDDHVGPQVAVMFAATLAASTVFHCLPASAG